MKTRTNLLMVAAGLVVAAFSLANANQENVDWDAFSKNLVAGLKSDNIGVQVSAMQQVIQHADKVDVDDAIFDIVSLYRSKDEKVRQLALATIHKTQNAWAMDFLKRSLKFEKSETLRSQIYHVLNEYEPGSVIAKNSNNGAVEYVVLAREKK